MKLEVKILLLSLLAGVSSAVTSWFWTTAFDSCWSNCGYELSSCSCSSSCVYNGNCCHDYGDYCDQTTLDILPTTGVVGSCSGTYTQQSGEFASPQYPSNYPNYAHCSWRIQSTGTKIIRLAFTYVQIESGPNCKYDAVRVYDGPSTSYPLLGVLCGSQTRTFFSGGNYLTVVFSSDDSTTYQGFVASWVFEEPPPYTTDQPYITGDQLYTTEGPPDTTGDLLYTTEGPPDTTEGLLYTTEGPPYTTEPPLDPSVDPFHTSTSPSCRWNCGSHLGSCSCSSSCQYYGNCCHDYHDYCYGTTSDPYPTTAPPSCRWNCGYNFGSCSCSSSCQYYGNCCHDFYDYCYTTTPALDTTSAPPSCRWNCGSHLGSCSCSSTCQYYGNCCHDFYDYCYTVTGTPDPPTAPPSCRWNCGYNFSSCSCSSSCQYYGNCCRDYHDYCYGTTSDPYPPVTHPTCGGRLSDSGSISSPYYPNYYHDNAYCVWQLSAPAGQRIFLSFVDLELERCCNCDYINVYDGSTTASSLLGKLCYSDTTLRDFSSSSSYMTVLFRSDGSGVARGFKAFFSSSLPENRARVVCSSERMTIVIQRSYLNSLGIGWQNLYVDDHRCRPSANSYEVSFNFPIDMCGTSKKTNNGRVVYNNHVRAAPSQSGEITRQLEQFLLSVNCHMEQDTTAGIVYKTKEMINDTIIGTGHFNASMAFYPSSSYSYPILDFPYEVSLNQYLYIQVQLSRADNTLDLLVDSCVASPNHDFQARSYTLIQNGCAKDSTVHIYTNGRQYYAQFRFRAFKFLRTHSYVFLQCRVIVCADNDYNSRCRQGCRTRKKRSLDSSHHTETVILGPITLKGAKTESADEVEKEE